MKHVFKIALILFLTFLTSFDLSAQTPIVICPQSASFTGMTRGYYFTAPTNFTICGIYVEDDMSTDFQSASIVLFTAGTPPQWNGTTNSFVTLWQDLNYVPNTMISVPNIVINAGDIIGIYGSRGSNSVNSYGPAQCVINIAGFPTTTYRSGMQFDLAAGPGMYDIWAEDNGSVGRVTMYSNCCPPPAAIPSVTGTTTVCLGDTVIYTAPAQTGAVSYNWTVPAGATINSGQNTTTASVIWNTAPGGQVCVDWTDGCGTSPQTCISVTVNQGPTTTTPANATYCNGDAVPIGTFTSSPAGGTFTWTNSDPTIGLAASGTGNAPAFTAINTSGSVITAIITVSATAGGCPGPDTTYTITVNPTPTVTLPANATYCNGDAVPIGTFTSSPAGATFAWTNSNTTIGLAASGTGNAPAFTTINNSGSVITAIITVIPTANGCVGLPVTYTITVNPTPTVTLPANATYCNGDAVPIGTFTSSPAGATFAWTNSNAAIGLAASGTGNAPAFTAINGSGSAITATITVVPTVNGCVGAPVTYTITINPGAMVNLPANITYCAGDAIPTSAYTSNPAGGTFVWTNSDPTIGLAASGTGSTPAFTAINTSNSPVTATISVIATAGSCPGIAASYTITINPIVTGTTYIAICQGDSALIGGVYYSAAGTYLATLTSSFGCDSILTTTLAINAVTTTTTPVVICDGDSALIEGNYYSTAGLLPFTFSSFFGCDSTIIYDVILSPLPSFNIVGGSAFINLGESVNLAVMPGVSGTTYSWNPPDGLSCIFCQNPTATPTESMWYYVTVTNSNGCQTIDSTYIDVDPSSNIYIPNIFSPNGSQDNNVYYVRGKGIKQFNIAIYNRWGQMVFESDDIEKGWDGTKNGTLLNQGVFVYSLNVVFYDGDTFQQTGNITLVR
ncbi:MAG: hypothetical protein COA97_04355 [Flavobacteriales bacterium]|nr:MAG: hypothetical protein COA97_04355 [Flavobacteriales bacterium]